MNQDKYGTLVVGDHKIFKDKDAKKRNRKVQEKKVAQFHRMSSIQGKPMTKQPVAALQQRISSLYGDNVRKVSFGRTSDEIAAHQRSISSLNKVKTSLMRTGPAEQKTAVGLSLANSREARKTHAENLKWREKFGFAGQEALKKIHTLQCKNPGKPVHIPPVDRICKSSYAVPYKQEYTYVMSERAPTTHPKTDTWTPGTTPHCGLKAPYAVNEKLTEFRVKTKKG